MMLLVHTAPTTLERHRHPNLGVLSSPRRFYLDVDGWTWAADNDAYSDWNADRYLRMLSAIAGVPGCRFVTAPDVVGDADRTLTLFEQWTLALVACGQPVALVAQDGLTENRVPWSQLGALFIGGSSEWKLSWAAARLVHEAKRRGLWVHMGRVNGHTRLRYAKAIGCDSVDGTSFSWFRDRWLEQFLDHAAAPRQETLGV